MRRLLPALVLVLLLGACGSTPTTPEGRGEALVTDLGCVVCHGDGDRALGPTWKGVAGSDRALDDGSVVTADDAYLRESITDPGAKVVAGWRPAMPLFYLGETELDDVVAYLVSLGSEAQALSYHDAR